MRNTGGRRGHPAEYPAVSGKAGGRALTGSIAVVADGNNLSDAASSVITLIGFRLAGQAADEEHPFGHGRIEYLSGLLVAMAILLMGFELGKSSLEKLLHPEQLSFSWLAIAILAVSIGMKFGCSTLTASWGRPSPPRQ